MRYTNHVEDLIALYALGGLDDTEAEYVASHLATCAACRHLAEEALMTVAYLPYAAQPAMPAPETKARLMARVGLGPARPASAAPRPLGFWGQLAATWRALSPALAVLALILTLVLTGLNLSLVNQISQLRQANDQLDQRIQEQEQALAQLADENRTLRQGLQEQEQRLALFLSPDIVVRNLNGTELAPEASGRIYFTPGETTGLLLVYGLSGLSPDETYQFWMIGARGPESAGLFQVGADGRGELALTLGDPFNFYQAVGVSREPAGGSPQPTRIVLLGEL
jgi:anti-sigma-K factor RskA